MEDRDAVYLAHMLETARKATEKAAAAGIEGFESDDTLQLALVHLVQVLGEAARLVSGEARARCPQIPWTQIIGMRNRVVHQYLDVDLEIVWKVVSEDLPKLVVELEKVQGPGQL